MITSSYGARAAWAVPKRAFSVASVRREESKPSSLLKTILHGSGEEEGDEHGHEVHENQVLNYIYEIQRADVKPEYAEQYRELVASVYPQLEESYAQSHAMGNYEVVVGGLGGFYHIWRHEGYKGFDAALKQQKTCPIYTKFLSTALPMLQRRQNYLSQAFSFKKPELTSGDDGCVYEMRTYHLHPGNLLEWERSWLKGLEARRVYAEPKGAWFSRVGKLHTVFHVWKYDSMEERARIREAAWQAKAWSTTVNETAHFVHKQTSEILRPF
ncbi:hypothetical protein ACI68E_001571 [Malassezia pachydermatis]